MKIWIVRGTTGEYSERGELTVMAFDTEEAAKAKVLGLQTALQASGIERLTWWDDDWVEAKDRFRAEHDPGFDIDRTGTSWFIEDCDLVTSQGNDSPSS